MEELLSREAKSFSIAPSKVETETPGVVPQVRLTLFDMHLYLIPDEPNRHAPEFALGLTDFLDGTGEPDEVGKQQSSDAHSTEQEEDPPPDGTEAWQDLGK